MWHGEKLGSVEEKHQIVAELGFERRQLGRLVLFVRRDAVATVHDPSAIGLLHVLRVDLALFATAQVFEQTLMLIVALDQAAAGSVVLRDGKEQSAVAGEREGRLHQAFAESALAEDPGAIVILQRAGQNLGGGSGARG